MEKQLTASQLATLLNVSPRTLETLIAQKKAPTHYLVGRTRRWDPQVVRAWIDAQISGKIDEATTSG